MPKLIVVPSYIRDALPADMPNVVELDERGDLPADVLAKVRAKEKAIVDGKFTVVVDDGQPKSSTK